MVLDTVYNRGDTVYAVVEDELREGVITEITILVDQFDNVIIKYRLSVNTMFRFEIVGEEKCYRTKEDYLRYLGCDKLEDVEEEETGGNIIDVEINDGFTIGESNE